MNHKDKLKEIEAKPFWEPFPFVHAYMSEKDKKYLIARVKELTEALEHQRLLVRDVQTPNNLIARAIEETARKALNGEGGK